MAEKLKITIVGQGLIGGSLYKAAVRAGFAACAVEKDDPVELGGTDLLLLALPQEKLTDWFARYAGGMKPGSVAVDTCGIKSAVCRELHSLVPPGCFFVGGHPMAGREHSGSAYATSSLFCGASMILTPDQDTPEAVLKMLSDCFRRLGFAQVKITTPERHDRMIAYTSQLSHVIAAAYAQEPLGRDAAGFTAGSYANMTRIASMDDTVWEKLFSANQGNLLAALDNFIGRLQEFRGALAKGETENIREFIRRGAAGKAASGVKCGHTELNNNDGFGRFLKLEVYGASHAPAIGMRLANFPRGFRVDMEELKKFMARRAPGHDELSTARHEADEVVFVSGIDGGCTTGEKLEAVIRNTDVRSQDYRNTKTVPRPGHADFTQFVRTGHIAAGGGANSGRMTAPICAAGGICLQFLRRRHIEITSQLLETAGRPGENTELIRQAGEAGDSVGGVIEITVKGLPPGLGGALFDGVESELSAALFAIPGAKGVSFGNGFAAGKLRGSENNDAFVLRDGRVETMTNRHGGLLGGITSGMPLLAQVALKPTPSIYLKQQSVNLATRTPETLQIQGRHDPCIVRRARPVAEALTALVLTDIILKTEAATPRICLTLTESTLQENCRVLNDNWPFADLAELRADYLAPEELAKAAQFPDLVKIPVILTLRRKQDGGQWQGSEDARRETCAKLLTEAETPFAYVDLEADFRHTGLEEIARSRGTAVIRSLHDFSGPVAGLIQRCQELKGSSDDIPKIACQINHAGELAELFRETADFTGFPHIICAMGELGKPSRILAERTHSLLSFTSPKSAMARLQKLGHLAPEDLVRTYNFRNLTGKTRLYAVTGWPLGHTQSPQINNAAFFARAEDRVMVPLTAETAAEAMLLAEVLEVRGMAVTIPHKTGVIPFMAELDAAAKAIGAVNTVIRTPAAGAAAIPMRQGSRQRFWNFCSCRICRANGWRSWEPEVPPGRRLTP